MAAEIEEQPLAMSRLLDRGLEPIRAIADQIREFDPQMVLLCGRGTSDHAALYFKYLLEIKQQIPVGLVSPSTLTSYNDGVLTGFNFKTFGLNRLAEKARVSHQTITKIR